MRKFIGLLLILALTSSARGQTAYSYRYWFDNNLATLQVGAANGETAIDIDISTLTKGSVHALHLQGLDARNKWSAVRTQYFFIAKEADTKSTTARYWYDDDETTVKLTPTVNGLIDLDISHLNVGTHAVHYQTFNAAGDASPVRTQYFFIAKEADTENVTARYWYDNDETTVKVAPTVNGLIDLDISHLNIGTHAVHYQTFNTEGEASPVRTQYFFMNELQLSTLSCQIWIDDNEEDAQTYALTNEDIVIEAEDLSYGIHKLHVALYDGNGQWLAQGSTTFVVTAPTVTITLSSYGEDTFSYNYDLDFSQTNDIRAYIASGYYPQTGYVLLTRVLEVPAGTGIVVKGEEGTYKVPYGESSAYYLNLLVGNIEPMTVEPTEGEYVNLYLTNGDNGYGFYPVTTSFTMNANKARLQLPARIMGGESYVKIAYEEDADAVHAAIGTTTDDSVYDLSGRKIDKPQKGINIIRYSDGTSRKVLR